MKTKLASLLCLAFFSILPAQAERIDIWSSIPFVRGADLCAYQDSFGQSRQEYMHRMTRLATDLMYSGSYGIESLELLTTFDQLYDKNRLLATRGRYLDVTLESTLKAFMSQYYRDYRPREERVSFRHLGNLRTLVNALKEGQRPDNYNDSMMRELDYIAYGSYSFAPNCQGNILVTLHLVGRDGRLISYQGNGKPSVVMSQIASRIFEDFQRTKFPSTIRIGNRTITLLGALNGNVGKVNRPRQAEEACEMLGGRLPNKNELELIDMLGDFSGGISIGKKVWALPGNKVYHPLLQNPTPVRSPSEVNAKEFLYYCIK